jgi:peptide deformylase
MDKEMAVLPIYTDGSPVLRKKALPVKQLTDDVIQLIMDMFETMRKASGIGLAANQVGVLQRVISIDVSEIEGLENIKPFALINPEVIDKKDSWTIEEGCLSVPDVRDEVERAKTIKVRFKDTGFHDREIEAGDLLARVMLHEIDHLNGILFIDYLTPEKRKMHAELLQKIHRGEIEVNYPVVTAADIPL